jgi:hypothetical protein
VPAISVSQSVPGLTAGILVAAWASLAHASQQWLVSKFLLLVRAWQRMDHLTTSCASPATCILQTAAACCSDNALAALCFGPSVPTRALTQLLLHQGEGGLHPAPNPCYCCCCRLR